LVTAVCEVFSFLFFLPPVRKQAKMLSFSMITFTRGRDNQVALWQSHFLHTSCRRRNSTIMNVRECCKDAFIVRRAGLPRNKVCFSSFQFILIRFYYGYINHNIKKCPLTSNFTQPYIYFFIEIFGELFFLVAW
jgi:hypothetical protein